MATTSVSVTSAAFTAIVAGPLDVYFQNKGALPINYRVDTTGEQGIDEDNHVLPQHAVHPVRIPDGSTLYARVAEKSNPRPMLVSYTEAYLGPEA